MKLKTSRGNIKTVCGKPPRYSGRLLVANEEQIGVAPWLKYRGKEMIVKYTKESISCYKSAVYGVKRCGSFEKILHRKSFLLFSSAKNS
ncbi:MAG: hypothetical protein J6R68_00920 [Clostridia bacterium]|nr:hypothetical protein [Clostridia bacterium]